MSDFLFYAVTVGCWFSGTAAAFLGRVRQQMTISAFGTAVIPIAIGAIYFYSNEPAPGLLGWTITVLLFALLPHFIYDMIISEAESEISHWRSTFDIVFNREKTEPIKTFRLGKSVTLGECGYVFAKSTPDCFHFFLTSNLQETVAVSWLWLCSPVALETPEVIQNLDEGATFELTPGDFVLKTADHRMIITIDSVELVEEGKVQSFTGNLEVISLPEKTLPPQSPYLPVEAQ